ncbi:MAG: cyclic nucleotide-binding domain-containing protein, partial [Anaerolineales bacterium]
SQDQRYITTLLRGDYFGEEALLFHQPRSATVIAVDHGVLLRIDDEQFYSLIEGYPQLRKNFSVTAESRRLAQKAEFDFLGKDEVIYLITRKHEIFLYLSLIPPIIMSLSGIPLAIIGALSMKLIWQLVLLFGGAICLGGGVVWGIWNQVNWGNDYYILTNQRVIWLENVIGFYSSRRETPLTAILAVNVLSSAWGRMFHFGSVDVRTYTGSILMRNMANPDIFEAFLRGHRERAYNRNRELERQKMEETLRTRFKMDEQGLVPTKPIPPLKPIGEPQKTPSPTFEDFLDTFFKMRYEQNGVITYRKHWFVLIRKTWAAMLGFFALFSLTAYLLYTYYVLQEQWLF